MVYLSCSIPKRNSDIVQQVILWRGKVYLNSGKNSRFTTILVDSDSISKIVLNCIASKNAQNKGNKSNKQNGDDDWRE